jgi:hypothetical protein
MHFGQSFHFSAGNGYCCYLHISSVSLKAVGIAVWVPASAYAASFIANIAKPGVAVVPELKFPLTCPFFRRHKQANTH